MKRLILIPTILITGLTPAISLVGCNKNNNLIISAWNLKDGEPVWTYSQPSDQYDTVDDVTNAYYNSINPQLLADDLAYSTANYVWTNRGIYDEFNIKIEINKIDKQEKRLSLVSEVTTVAPEYRYQKIICKDVPFDFNYEDQTTYSEWILHPTGTSNIGQLPDEYWNDKKWSVGVYIINPNDIIKQTLNYTIKDDVTLYWRSIITFTNAFKFPSKYFEKVTLKE